MPKAFRSSPSPGGAPLLALLPLLGLLAGAPARAQDGASEPPPEEAAAPSVDEGAPDAAVEGEPDAPGTDDDDAAGAGEEATPADAPAVVDDAAPDAPVAEAPAAGAPAAPPAPTALDGTPAAPTDDAAGSSAGTAPAKGDKPKGDKPKGDAASSKEAAANQAAAVGNPALLAGGRSWVFRGSAVRFRNLLSARSALKNLELTYNPEYTTVMAVMPQVWWGNSLNFSGYLDVSREWTKSDWTTYEGEWQLSDLWLSAAATNFWTIPILGIGMSAGANLQLPSSKASWGDTLMAGFSGSYSLFRAFPLLSGFIVGYGISGQKNFHQFTEGKVGSSLQDGTCFASDLCQIYGGTGVRNVEWTLTNRLFAMFNFAPWIGISGSASVTNMRLYPMTLDPSITFFPDDPTGIYGTQNWRHAVRVVTSLYVTPHPAVTFLVGTDTANPQLAPNGRYRIPGINRFTYVYADMMVNFGGLAGLVMDDIPSWVEQLQ